MLWWIPRAGGPVIAERFVLMIITLFRESPPCEGICCHTASLLWMKFGSGLHRSPCKFFVATCGLVI